MCPQCPSVLDLCCLGTSVSFRPRDLCLTSRPRRGTFVKWRPTLDASMDRIESVTAEALSEFDDRSDEPNKTRILDAI